VAADTRKRSPAAPVAVSKTSCHSGQRTVAVDDIPAMQVAQAGARIGSDGQAAAPRQLGGCRVLLTGCCKAVVQAAAAAVFCAAIRKRGEKLRSSHLVHAAKPPSCVHVSPSQKWLEGTPVISAGGSATSPMNCTMLRHEERGMDHFDGAHTQGMIQHAAARPCHLPSTCAAATPVLPPHLGWRMRLITAASACRSCSTFSGSSSWPRSKSSAPRFWQAFTPNSARNADGWNMHSGRPIKMPPRTAVAGNIRPTTPLAAHPC